MIDRTTGLACSAACQLVGQGFKLKSLRSQDEAAVLIVVRAEEVDLNLIY